MPHLLVLLLACLLLAGCNDRQSETASAGTNPAREAAGRELVYASTKDIRDINPHLYGGEMAAQAMVFESLVVNTEEGVRPCLARSWDISPDGRVYTFYLRKDVTFSDGTPFTAEVVRLNMEAVLANRARHAWLALVRVIEGHEVVDAHTYRLRLRTPYYPALIELGLVRPFRFVAPACLVNGTSRRGLNGCIGTGPWILEEHRRHQYALFRANPRYWGHKPAFERLRWKVVPDHQSLVFALQKGDADLVLGADGDMFNLDTFAVLQKDRRLSTAQSRPIASRALLLNSNADFTREREVRLALQHAINREGIVQHVLNATETVADTLLSPSVPYCDLNLAPRSHDPQKAAALLDAAGWLPGSDGLREKAGKKAHLVLSYNADNALERTIGEYIQADLKRIGVELELCGEEKQAFLDRQKTGRFQMQYALSWGAPYDPQSYLSSWRLPAHGDYQAQTGLKRKAWLDATITELMAEQDEKRRAALYREVLTYVHEEAVYLPLSYSRTRAVYRKALTGVTFGCSQYEIPFEKMRFAAPGKESAAQ